MCERPKQVEAAVNSGLSVEPTCCKRKDQAGYTIAACSSFLTCTYQAQMREKPDVWICSHNLLFASPKGIEKARGVIIDEGFFDKGIEKGEGIPLSDLLVDTHAPTARLRQMLVAVLANQKNKTIGKPGVLVNQDGPVHYRTIVGVMPRKDGPEPGWYSFYMPAEVEPFLDHDRAVATCKEAISQERDFLASMADDIKPNMSECLSENILNLLNRL